MANADPGNDPLGVDVAPQPSERNRVTAAFRLILIIPAFVYTVFIAAAATSVVIVAAFAVLCTGRWPEGLRTFVLNAGRLTLRIGAHLERQRPPSRSGQTGSRSGRVPDRSCPRCRRGCECS
jgi:hypothetical protein